MGEMKIGFVPLGEYTPDLRYFANSGLIRAENVVPVYGDYLASPALDRIALVAGSASAYGLHVDQRTGRAFAGIGSRLYEVLDDGTVTERSRAALYPGLPPSNGYWRGCSYGDAVIMTNYTEPVQHLVPGAAVFADMITSTFAPRARSCFSLRNNIFLANCYLTAAYDGLSAGANPTLLAWSGSDRPTQFGSSNANPEIIGADYQSLSFDIGDITGTVAGSDSSTDYGIIVHSNGVVRVDGPPYTCRVIVRDLGGLYPYGVCAAGQDVYLWTAAGLGRLRSGSGPLELVGVGRFVRALVDNATGFSDHPTASVGLLDASEAAFCVSMAYDAINDMLFVAYSENGDLYGRALLAYNIGEDRISWFQLRYDPVIESASQIQFLCSGRQNSAASWCPGRDLRFISSDQL
jgi:hypothetical protein